MPKMSPGFRAKWGAKIEFMLTCIGYSVGLGNVWRFPYLAFKNGGAMSTVCEKAHQEKELHRFTGAFLIPYWCMQIFVGMPLFYLELSFGQFASQGPLTIWSVCPPLKGIGICMIIVSALILVYYNVVISYCAFYFFSSMQSPLPWSHCDHYWSSPHCSVDGDNKTTVFNNLTDVIPKNTSITGGVGVTKISDTISPIEDYFRHFALEQTEGIEHFGNINWKLSLCLLFSWVLVFLVLIKGIKSMGKVVYFTALVPYALLFSLLIRLALLPGATQGMLYFLTPRWERLADGAVWNDAATQVFYSLGVCMGGLNLMASFNNFKNNSFRDAMIVPCVDCFASFLAGLVVFSVLGFMAHTKNVDIEEVAVGGPGLAFIAYPEAVSNMPAPTVWAVFFFFMMTVIGLSANFTMVETIVSSLGDQFPTILKKSRKTTLGFRFVVCILFYVLALPLITGGGIYVLNILDRSVAGFPLLIIGIVEVVALMFVYGYKRFAEDLKMMLGKSISGYWRFCWCFVTPLVMAGILLFKICTYSPLTYGDYKYPWWGELISWAVVSLCVVFLPGWFVVYVCKHGMLSLLRQLCQPSPQWGPLLPENRTGRYATSLIEMKDLENTNADIPTIVINDYDDFVKDEHMAKKCSSSERKTEKTPFTEDDDLKTVISKNTFTKGTEIGNINESGSVVPGVDKTRSPGGDNSSVKKSESVKSFSKRNIIVESKGGQNANLESENKAEFIDGDNSLISSVKDTTLRGMAKGMAVVDIIATKVKPDAGGTVTEDGVKGTTTPTKGPISPCGSFSTSYDEVIRTPDNVKTSHDASSYPNKSPVRRLGEIMSKSITDRNAAHTIEKGNLKTESISKNSVIEETEVAAERTDLPSDLVSSVRAHNAADTSGANVGGRPSETCTVIAGNKDVGSGTESVICSMGMSVRMSIKRQRDVPVYTLDDDETNG